MTSNSVILSLLLVYPLAIGIISCHSLINIDKAKEALLKVDAEFSKTSVEKNASEAFFQYMAEDAILLSPTPPVEGREAIRNAMP